MTTRRRNVRSYSWGGGSGTDALRDPAIHSVEQRMGHRICKMRRLARRGCRWQREPSVPGRPIAAAQSSNCICQVPGIVHFCRLLHNAFAMVTSFLATAVMMTLCGFPASRRRSAKDFRLGL